MPTSRALRGLLVLGGAAVLAVVPAATASAHPLGNFTVNSYSGVVVGPDDVRVDHVLDYAEIPTVQQEVSIGHDLPAYAARSCATTAGKLRLSLGGKAVTLAPVSSTARLLPGAAGLQTLRVECSAAARVPGGTSGALSFADVAVDDHVGWHEVTLRGDRTTLSRSDAPAQSVSARLTAYPADLLSSPRNQREGHAQVRAGGTALAAEVAGAPAVVQRPVDALSRAFEGLVGDGRVGIGALVVALLLAAGVGAAHAVAPGHGKTVMAFYLAGRQARSLRSALTVASTVTATHTAGVLVLGVLVSAGAAFAPASVYPWLSVVSGLVVLVVGVGLVRQVRRGRGLGAHGHSHGEGHAHSHGEGHAHSHSHEQQHGHPHGEGHAHGHSHEDGHSHAPAEVAVLALAGAAEGANPAVVHGHPHEHAAGHAPAHVPSPAHAHEAGSGHSHGGGHSHSHGGGHSHGHTDEHPHDHGHEHPERGAHRRGLVAMGLAGGLVPSPTAVVVLLGAVATGHWWLGVALVLAFGVGMATTLTTVGILVATTGERLRRFSDSSARSPRLLAPVLRVAPWVAAGGVCLLGTAVALKGLLAV
ncbi:high-affinity nickel-transport protein [Motilibacter rhizosphaerae]|uniref:High-affinity nickel-transport protein n=1 Tax=Motilibacter rhizosphaerae TaxID=598652 RepID=A0A4Q7NRK7_9ACTN|nr:sulfite exporter TauE/SafE family protein [Motilibacter rhizosphaerae]RZS89681.1 high-affinity nickel-transport protein [Motilibacter rhizosphaerae]